MLDVFNSIYISIFYKGFSYIALLAFIVVEIICHFDKINKKNYYYLIALMFPISYVMAYILKLALIVISKMFETKNGKKFISWLNKEVEFKRKKVE